VTVEKICSELKYKGLYFNQLKVSQFDVFFKFCLVHRSLRLESKTRNIIKLLSISNLRRVNFQCWLQEAVASILWDLMEGKNETY